MKNFCVLVGAVVGYFSSVAYRNNQFAAMEDPTGGFALGIMWLFVYLPVGVCLGMLLGAVVAHMIKRT